MQYIISTNIGGTVPTELGRLSQMNFAYVSLGGHHLTVDETIFSIYLICAILTSVLDNLVKFYYKPQPN